jgi:nucleotide-binding universal stress UspA family protein
MRIICGTDFSDNATIAERAAAAIAKRARCLLELVHVRSAAGASGEAVAQAQLEAEAERLRGRGAEVTSRLLTGRPDEALVEHAQHSGATLLVVAALGEPSGERWFVGSTAERVAQTSSVPVLVIRTAEAFEAWANESRPLRMLVGADFSASSDAAVRWSRELARAGPCSSTVAHVYWPPEEYARRGIKGPMSLVDGRPEVERVLAHELSARLDAAGPSEATIRVQPSFGRVADGLALMAIRDASDLVVVGTRQHSGLARLWHGSVSCGVLDATETAVVCVPVAEQERAEQPVVVPRSGSVLAATDLSELANRAVGHAYAAVDDGGWVHLVHIHEAGEASAPNPLYAHYVPSRAPTPEDRRRVHAELEGRLTALTPPEADARGIRTQVHVIEASDVSAAIDAAAERLGVSLICVGSHGRSGVVRALLGSVAQSVVAASRCPVLVVPVAPRR